MIKSAIEAINPNLSVEFKDGGAVHAVYANFRAVLFDGCVRVYRNGKPVPAKWKSSKGVIVIRKAAAVLIESTK